MINLSFGKYILKKIKNPADIFFVIPAQAGIHSQLLKKVDSRLRGNDSVRGGATQKINV